MVDEKNGLDNSFRALGIFQTLRANLALVDSFTRNSVIDDTCDTSGMDLGFLWVPTGDSQASVHNRAVTTFVTSLLYQVIENYVELKTVRKNMESSEVEEFLSQIPNSAQFINGMRLIRNGTFHVNSPKYYIRKDIAGFWRTLDKTPQILYLMLQTFYGFTEKVFMGEIKICPDSVYERDEEVERFFAQIRAGIEHD